MRLAVFGGDGAISRVVSCHRSQSGAQAREGELSIEVDSEVTDTTHYIREGQAVEKSALSPTVTADGMEATVSGLPSGLTVLWDGEEGETDDEPLELDHDEPGTYTLRILGGAPYFDTSIEVTLD